MLRLSSVKGVALLSALVSGTLSAWPSPIFAQDAPVTTQAEPASQNQAEVLRARLREVSIPVIADIGLDAPRDLTSRMVDAEMYFSLREYANAAALLTPALEDPSFASHPGASRARWLVAESLFRTGALELARSQFQNIVDLNDTYYARGASMRLLEIAILRRDAGAVDRQYEALSRRYGASADPEVDFLRGRAMWYRGLLTEAIEVFGRVPSDHEYYWKAQYHAAVAVARTGDLDAAYARFIQIESALEGAVSTHDDHEVLNLARLARGILHYERGEWDEAVSAYASVSRTSSAFEQALYQVAWTMIREGRYEQAIESLEILALISSNSRLISDARLINAELRRRTEDYDCSIAVFESVWSDYELMRSQLREVAVEEGSAAQRLDASADILTGSVFTGFDYRHWLTSDPTVRAAVALVREADELGVWLGGNHEISDEIREALQSGFAFDRVSPLRQARQQVVEILDQAVVLRSGIATNARQRAGELSGDARTSWESASTGAQRAEAEYFALPRTHAEMDASITLAREELNVKILEIYRDEQRVMMELDNLRASDDMIRDRVRMSLESVDSAQRSRQSLREERARLVDRLNSLREVRGALQRRRVRYGIGESQSALANQAAQVRTRSEEELALLGASGTTLSSLRALEAELDQALQLLDRRVTDAWTSAWQRLRQEEGALAALDRRYTGQRQGELQVAERTAMGGFHEMIGEVEQVTLRASLGQIDVAWWQKEVVSQRIDALFRERERQIERLDADFSEIRE